MFVGGLHNTCNEYVKFFDIDRVPASHRAEFAEACAVGRGGHRAERPRAVPAVRVGPADDHPSEQARQHMDDPGRGPGAGAAGVGPRDQRACASSAGASGPAGCSSTAARSSRPTTRPRTTPTRPILTRTLAAVFPVCGGINLEYYFSHVDPTGYGCGTKLPHNITSLLGVMDGAASDLRTGLPWQMVEIHEPVRLLFVCETTPDDDAGRS